MAKSFSSYTIIDITGTRGLGIFRCPYSQGFFGVFTVRLRNLRKLESSIADATMKATTDDEGEGLGRLGLGSTCWRILK